MAVEESGIYKGLVELDVMLQKAVDAVDKAFDGFDNLEDASVQYAQEKIDKACEQMSEKINTSLEKKKIDVCNALKKKYHQMQDCVAKLKPIVDLLSLKISLDTVVSGLVQTITAFATPYVKPYQDAVKFIAEFAQKATPLIQNISKNAQTLASSPDRARDKVQNINPRLNIDKLKISFTPPNIQDIIG